MSSKYESRVATLLTSLGLSFSREYIFPNLKGLRGRPYRFDFAVFSPFGGIAYLIEVNGEQHYKPVDKFGGNMGLISTRFRDSRKIAYCREHKIPLLIIPYSAIDKLTPSDVTLYSKWRFI